MKYIILIISLVAVAFGYSQFCVGFKDGFKEGYCYDRSLGCIAPQAPNCPIPRIGEDTYSGGWARGWMAGVRRSQR